MDMLLQCTPLIQNGMQVRVCRPVSLYPVWSECTLSQTVSQCLKLIKATLLTYSDLGIYAQRYSQSSTFLQTHLHQTGHSNIQWMAV